MSVASGRAPLVVLCSVDDWRFDAVNHQPDRRYWKALNILNSLTMPNMDSFAGESVCFATALAAAGYTPPSHASLFTGTYTRQHGVVDFWRTSCREDVATITEMFTRAGYRTVLHTTPGRKQLFCEVNRSLRDVRHVTGDLAELGALLRAEPWVPTLIVAHWLDVHDPPIRATEEPGSGHWEFKLLVRLAFGGRVIDDSTDLELPDGRRVSYWDAMSDAAQDPEATRRQIRLLFNAYLHGVEKFDAKRFGPFLQLLRGLPVWDRAVMAVTADHGEIQSRTVPSKLWHGPGVEEQLTRVPLMIRAPGFGHRMVTDLVGLIDVVPTLLELAGVDPQAVGVRQTFDGRSMAGAMSGRPHGASSYWIESWFMDPNDGTIESRIASRALRYADGRKYVHNGDLRVWERIDQLSVDELAEFMSRTAFLATATPWFKGRVQADCAAGKPRLRMLADWHRCGRPALAMYDNVNDDICERNAILVDPQHPRWPEFEPQLQRMLDLTAEPNGGVALTPQQEAQLTEHLASLGYLE